MRTATDRLGNVNDNRVEILRHDRDTGAVRVRYINSGTESTIHVSHLEDFGGTAEKPAFEAGPLKAVPGADKINGSDARVIEWRTGWKPTVGASVAHTQRTAPGTVTLFVMFGNGKRRSVGEYATHAEAQRAYHAGTYGF